MMDETEARDRIRRLNDEHESDHDGGYALLDALKGLHAEFGPKARASFVRALSDFARAEEPGIWAVALETLVQVGAREEVTALGDEIGSSSRDATWRDHIVLGLLRLGQGQFRNAIVDHLHSSLGNPRTLTLPILAALCRVDRNQCLELASTYFAGVHARGEEEEVEGYVPAFVGNFLAVDEQLLAALVRMLAARRPGAGEWLARRLDDYLRKPWILEEIGVDRAAGLRADIAAGTRQVN